MLYKITNWDGGAVNSSTIHWQSKMSIPRISKQLVSLKTLEDGMEFETPGLLEKEESCWTYKHSDGSEPETKDMQVLTEDGNLKKQTIRSGTGPKLPDLCIVLIHYAAYLERQSVPFDSTREKEPHRFVTNHGTVIPGLDIAVQTMRVGEVAKVWIHWTYGFMKQGCPPRIPKEANLIYTVEVVNFIDDCDAISIEKLLPQEKSLAPLQTVIRASERERQEGNKLFNEKKFEDAIFYYKRAGMLLNDMFIDNDQEEEIRIDELIKVYTNLSLIYYMLGKYAKTVEFCKCVLDVKPKNCKALYRLGRAYLKTKDFKKAQHYLEESKALDNNVEVNKALVELRHERRQQFLRDKTFCEKMFQ